MAWQGKIIDFKQTHDSWSITVGYYNDVAPAITFLRTIKMPITATKAETVAAIQAKGDEVRRMAKLNEENFVGQVIPIP